MKDWIPLLQSLLWPLVVVWAIFQFRPTFQRLLSGIAKRIEQGDPFEAGSSGVKLGSGQQPKLEVGPQGEKKLVAEDELPHQIYLVHSTRRDRKLDKAEYEYYRLRIWIDADMPELLNPVSSVIYHLHPTFHDPVRTVSDQESQFALATACWGEFNMYAEITFKDGRAPLRIERYIDL
ncbi:MAG TPA: pYEATS domain-containing protein [Burkholderiales bacterium]|nr:pYEATS domain-containing protein [Burkholderiales bacterium]